MVSPSSPCDRRACHLGLVGDVHAAGEAYTPLSLYNPICNPACQNRPCRGLRPGQPLKLHPNLSCAACPCRDGPRCALLRAAVAGGRSAREGPPGGGGGRGGSAQKGF